MKGILRPEKTQNHINLSHRFILHPALGAFPPLLSEFMVSTETSSEVISRFPKEHQDPCHRLLGLIRLVIDTTVTIWLGCLLIFLPIVLLFALPVLPLLALNLLYARFAKDNSTPMKVVHRRDLIRRGPRPLSDPFPRKLSTVLETESLPRSYSAGHMHQDKRSPCQVQYNIPIRLKCQLIVIHDFLPLKLIYFHQKVSFRSKLAIGVSASRGFSHIFSIALSILVSDVI